MLAKVEGGTGARCKQPLREPAKDWRCQQGHTNRGYATRCLERGCNERRPK